MILQNPIKYLLEHYYIIKYKHNQLDGKTEDGEKIQKQEYPILYWNNL